MLEEETRRVLEVRVRAGSTPQRDAERARIILLAAEGVPSRRISSEVGMHESHVAMWRQRFLAQGLDGLRDAKGRGAKIVYGLEDRMKIVALATSQRDPDELEATWTYQALADELKDEVGISRSALYKFLAGLDIKPHKVVG